MKFFWKVTNRKSSKWTDLIAVPDAGPRADQEIFIDDPVLDKPVRHISVEDIAGVIRKLQSPQTFIVLDEKIDGISKRLHSDLVNGVRKRDRARMQNWAIFFANAECDPGPGSVEHEIIAATTEDKAVQLFFKKHGRELEEFCYYEVWPADALIKFLSSGAAGELPDRKENI